MARVLLTSALAGVAASLVALLCIMVLVGLDDQSTPIAVQIGSAVLTVTAALAASSRAQAAKTEAGHARRAAEYSVSQTASIRQQLTAHAGEICPALYCPLRRVEER